jgi:hypothetical protein
MTMKCADPPCAAPGMCEMAGACAMSIAPNKPADPFPMPWQVDGLAIRAANGTLVLRVVEAVAAHPETMATIVVAPQMHTALQETRQVLLDSMRVMRGALRLLAELTAETRSTDLAKACAEMAELLKGGAE